MAGDLIPPPSPAGRPDPDPPARTSTEPAPPAPAAEPSGPPGESPFRTRFGFVWGVLAGVAVCAVALAGVLVATAKDDSGPPLARDWSDWQPSTSRMLAGAQEIAQRMSRQYQLDSGQPITLVDSGPPQFKSVPAGVAVLPSGGQVEVLEGPALLYSINLVDEEDKSADKRTRDHLLKREALELALYSFRYLDDVTMVAVALPTEGKVSRAVFYRPGDLLPELQVPLAKTLAPTPPRPKKLSKADVARIDSLVPRHLFESSIRPLDGSKPYFVLAESEIVDGS
ncbi:MAG TPA: hypothetical protein VFX51_02400 [Solirubrobacteraceae bacterium]|nr:hypothetical protein [Solirubrobacteraceae bacterium]